MQRVQVGESSCFRASVSPDQPAHFAWKSHPLCQATTVNLLSNSVLDALDIVCAQSELFKQKDLGTYSTTPDDFLALIANLVAKASTPDTPGKGFQSTPDKPESSRAANQCPGKRPAVPEGVPAAETADQSALEVDPTGQLLLTSSPQLCLCVLQLEKIQRRFSERPQRPIQ